MGYSTGTDPVMDSMTLGSVGSLIVDKIHKKARKNNGLVTSSRQNV